MAAQQGLGQVGERLVMKEKPSSSGLRMYPGDEIPDEDAIGVPEAAKQIADWIEFHHRPTACDDWHVLAEFIRDMAVYLRKLERQLGFHDDEEGS